MEDNKESSIAKDAGNNKDDEVKIKKVEKNILEIGNYVILGPDNGEILFDKILLKANSGAERIWKVKSIDRKNIILEIEKFG